MEIFVNQTLLASNPFYDAFTHSDLLGKSIFMGLFILSIWSWILLIQKIWMLHQARQECRRFREVFIQHQKNPLTLESNKHLPNPFLNIYRVLKRHTVEILNKNRRFGAKSEEEGASYLSETDIDFIQSHLATAVASQTQYLDKNLFILSTVVSLAPFLGLLGTVWGILIYFSDLQNNTAGSSSHLVLGGLSLALTTTVLGLLVAIPALIAYNYLKNLVCTFETDMQGFANETLATVEMQYRKVDLPS